VLSERFQETGTMHNNLYVNFNSG